MIVCDNCGAADDEAMNMDWTMMIKNNKIQNIDCLKCGKMELRSLMLTDEIIILEERTCDTARNS